MNPDALIEFKTRLPKFPVTTEPMGTAWLLLTAFAKKGVILYGIHKYGAANTYRHLMKANRLLFEQPERDAVSSLLRSAFRFKDIQLSQPLIQN